MERRRDRQSERLIGIRVFRGRAGKTKADDFQRLFGSVSHYVRLSFSLYVSMYYSLICLFLRVPLYVCLYVCLSLRVSPLSVCLPLCLSAPMMSISRCSTIRPFLYIYFLNGKCLLLSVCLCFYGTASRFLCL